MTSQSRVVFTGIVVVVAALSGPAGAASYGCDSRARVSGNQIAATDAPANIAAGNETNNTREEFVQIGSDLSVSALSAPSRAAVGSAIVVTDTTTNPGAGGADASVTAFYLSANSTLDATDVRLAPARAVGPLAAGAASAGAANVIIPEIAPGAWFLIANADDDGLVDEMAESNNARIVSIHIVPTSTRPR
jgi:trimeric autotransporter adhesin